METLNNILHTDIYNGTSLSDVLTLDFLASLLGNVVTGILILLLV